MEKNRPQSFDEALDVIDQAMQAQSPNLKDLLNSDYSNARTAADDLAPRLSREFQAMAAPYIDAAREAAGPAIAGGKTLAKEFDLQLRKNPYLVLGGIALGAIAVGYFVGKARSSSAEEFTGLSYGDVQPTDNVELA